MNMLDSPASTFLPGIILSEYRNKTSCWLSFITHMCTTHRHRMRLVCSIILAPHLPAIDPNESAGFSLEGRRSYRSCKITLTYAGVSFTRRPPLVGFPPKYPVYSQLNPQIKEIHSKLEIAYAT